MEISEQLSLIHSSEKSNIYLQRNENPNNNCIIKIHPDEHSRISDLQQLRNEYNILKEVNAPRIRKVISKGKFKNQEAIFLEYFPGVSVRTYFKEFQYLMTEKLRVAYEMALALDEVHQFSIIHKDVNTENFLINPATGAIKLIDFGISIKLDIIVQVSDQLDRLEGVLDFISPEQTGRIFRKVDKRSDLYSLGICFYEIFTGDLPFQFGDPLELIHAHIAKIPESPTARKQDVPEIISKIILRLLSKNPEDRYKTASGLCADLKKCIDSMDSKEQIEEFEICTNDFATELRIPEKLYGRDTEIKTLFHSIDQIKDGYRKLVLIGGYSGTGKSFLVRELYEPIAHLGGHFIEGKFSQIQPNIPYSAIIQALDTFIDMTLVLDEEQLKNWREKINASLEGLGKILVAFHPRLELLLGEQPAFPKSEGGDELTRFNHLLVTFFYSISTKESPLVIFLDDMQWADNASIGFLEVLLTQNRNASLLLICTYRENEVEKSQSFLKMIHEVESGGHPVEKISLKDLQINEVKELLADTFSCDQKYVSNLADLILEKTGGNPFFVGQLLKNLYKENLIHNVDLEMDSSKSNGSALRWHWDLEKIKNVAVSNNVVDLMASSILKLPPISLEILRISSLAGNQFSLALLSATMKIDIQECAKSLYKTIEEGFILPVNKGNLIIGADVVDEADAHDIEFKFLHDKIQQAALTLSSLEEKEKWHLEFGRKMLEITPEDQIPNKLFDVLTQLNSGINRVKDIEEKLKIAQLNYQGAEKARQSVAYHTAFEYLQTALSLLPEDAWHSHYDFCLKLHDLAGETAGLIKEYDKMTKLTDLIILNGKNIRDKLNAYEVKMASDFAQGKPGFIDTGLEILELLGEKIPSHPTQLTIALELVPALFAMRNVKAQDFLSMKEMKEIEKVAALRILDYIIGFAYIYRPNILPIMIFRMVRITLKYGICKYSVTGVGMWGVIIASVLGKRKEGYQFVEVSKKIVQRFPSLKQEGNALGIYCNFQIHWFSPFREAQTIFTHVMQLGLRAGDFIWGMQAGSDRILFMYMAGFNIKELMIQLQEHENQIASYKVSFIATINSIVSSVFDDLTNSPETPFYKRIYLLNKENRTYTGVTYIMRAGLALHFGDQEAFKYHVTQAKSFLDALMATYFLVLYNMYHSLLLLNEYKTANTVSKRIILLKVAMNQKQMAAWAVDCKSNFQHKYDLVEAEKYRTLKQYDLADHYYERAIKGAMEYDYLNEASLALERSARCCLESGRQTLGNYLLEDTWKALDAWGAGSKQIALEKEFPWLKTKVSAKVFNAKSTIHNSTIFGSQSSIDLKSIVKASTAISKNIVLRKLLSELMGIVLENAGAENGILMLHSNGNLFIQARTQSKDKGMSLLESLPVKGSELLPESVIQSVSRTRETLLIQDASQHAIFGKDPYVLQHKIKSVLCLPLINTGQLTGMIYLENNLTIGAFTSEREEVLSILSGQIAVALDNALLYENLEIKVNERTQEIKKEKERSDELLLNILPYETAEELKQFGKSKPRKFQQVSILFTDFVGFTRISETLSPEQLVNEIDTCFNEFDKIISNYRLEKIKTIGDSYMCAGGLPVPSATHAQDIVQAALEIRDFIARFNKERVSSGLPIWEVRIGVNSGPVIAGVVGSKKFAYDVWGDTVNIASRMESGGMPGQVNISFNTYQLVKEQFDVSPRGKLSVKNHDEIEMYFVNGRL